MLMFCIRHGESTYNAQGRVQGHLNIPLSELGRRSGSGGSRGLPNFRGRGHFLQPVAAGPRDGRADRRGLGPPDPHEPGPDRNRGRRLSGHSRDELDRLCPEEYARWRSGDPDYAVPGGEWRRALMPAAARS